MATKKIENELASFSVRHRALCLNGDYKGPWRANVDDAFEDANRHRSKPGNQTHSIRIETEQKMSIAFAG